MSLSPLPLSYCTNVHPGVTLAEVEDGLARYAALVRQRFNWPLAAGLWLAEPVVKEILSDANGEHRLCVRLAERGLTCHTLNAFPFGNFHDTRVKENVYLPDWSNPARLGYTLQCAQVLAGLLRHTDEGSISTLPLGFKGFEHPPTFIDAVLDQLIQCARGLAQIAERTQNTIRLAIEPEPLCLLETTTEAIDFFDRLRDRARRQGSLEAVQTHIGLCFDVCHQAVEFEDVAESIRRLDRAGVRINKVHISCALEIGDPMKNRAGREALKRYVEPRYLHQTIAKMPDGQLARLADLNEGFLANPPADFAAASAWRVHFHVPVYVEGFGPLATTRPALREALMAVSALDYAPHLEVETYTWQVMPGAGRVDLVEGLTRELLATEQLLAEIPFRSTQA